MSWLKKLTTDWQYLHNVESTKLIQKLFEENQALKKKVEALEKFAKQSEKYFALNEARRQADLQKKGN